MGLSDAKTNGSAATDGLATGMGGNPAPGSFKQPSHAKAIALYEEEAEHRPMVASILSHLIDYSSTVQNVSTRKTETLEKANNDATGNQQAPVPKVQSKRPQLGTVVGVYLPTMQNIFGVLLFLRLAWIVGTAGVFQAFAIVLLCCSCTMLTAISMSAIATNGYVPAGGSYFMISRALGPECGGAVGVLFFIGTSFAAAMYIIGAVEILLTYISQDIAIFRPIGNSVEGVSTEMLNNMRVYGSMFLVAMATLVFVGVKYVNKLAGLFLTCVIMSILCIYIGFFTSSNVDSSRVCIITTDDLPGFGGREMPTLISLSGQFDKYDCSFDSSPDHTGLNIYDMYCSNKTEEVCFEEFPFLKGDISIQYGIPGITSGELLKNLDSFYRLKGEIIPGIAEKIATNTASVKADITTSAMILTGIFFPSCTGIMAGSNRSGDLRNAAASIPIGTIGAIITTSIVYLSFVLLFGSVASGAMLRDKFGASVGGELLCALLAFPNKYVVLFGAFFSTVGAGLQSLTGAPRLLQAIARDDILPPLKYFAKGKKNGEPSWALLLSAAIAEVGILIASVDSVAPIITIFFLMCYLFVNLACAVQTLLKSPNWRPKFRFYHWGLSLLGMAICLFIMFISNWWQALIAMLIALCLYKYIEYAGAKKEWGDGIRGLSLSAALYGLRRLEDSEVHTKNWRPQILALVTENEDVSHAAINSNFPFPFISQLKAGKGLTIVGSIVEGGLNEAKCDERELLAESLTNCMQKNKVKGFTQVSISRDLLNGYINMLQLSGLGGLKPNTVLMTWPKEIMEEQQQTPSEEDEHHQPISQSPTDFTQQAKLFSDVLHGVTSSKQHVFIAVKNQHLFPTNKELQAANCLDTLNEQETCAHGNYISHVLWKLEKKFVKRNPTIDIWWIVHDGGILMLLGFLLRQHKVWRQTTMRIFTVAQPEDNSIKIKKDLEQFLSLLRIEATVDVIEMPSDDISAYTYEKTLIMEQRNKLLQNLNMSRRESRREVQVLTDSQRHKFSMAAAASGQSHLSPPYQPQISTSFEEQASENLQADSTAPANDHEVVNSTSGLLKFYIRNEKATDAINESVVDSDEAAANSNDLSNANAVVENNHLAPPNAKSRNTTKKGNSNTSFLVPESDRELKPDEKNVKAMDAAEKLNSVVIEKSSESKLVFINLPAPPHVKSPQKFYNYFQFVESMVKDLKMPIVLVRGSGREFVTIYS
ncbi:solute carrier family 12 member 7-like isoform X4 [Convolutriloba macropyga]|uniref:solute carrier family 12 member 7-like isoform X4 n=1 Tax=Convolutriloba macropyga TaxID=536237 RepID=UPI003F52882B